jgi:hypothetical protein
MMDGSSRDDIRRLLKGFGIAADEAIISHLARTQGTRPLHLRITLQDLTDYQDAPPQEPLHLEIEGHIQR